MPRSPVDPGSVIVPLGTFAAVGALALADLKLVGVKAPRELKEILRGARREARTLQIGADLVIADTPEEDQYGGG